MKWASPDIIPIADPSSNYVREIDKSTMKSVKQVKLHCLNQIDFTYILSSRVGPLPKKNPEFPILLNFQFLAKNFFPKHLKLPSPPKKSLRNFSYVFVVGIISVMRYSKKVIA